MKSVLPSWHMQWDDHKPQIYLKDAPSQMAGLVPAIQNAVSWPVNISLDFIIV